MWPVSVCRCVSGPQGADGETGEERAQAEETAEDLHEESTGAGR